MKKSKRRWLVRASAQRIRRTEKVSNTLVLHEEGPPCRNCGRLMQVRRHAQITDKLLQQPYYYSRWYRCRTAHCRTTLVMPHEFIVRVVPEHEDTWDAVGGEAYVGPAPWDGCVRRSDDEIQRQG